MTRAKTDAALVADLAQRFSPDKTPTTLLLDLADALGLHVTIVDPALQPTPAVLLTAGALQAAGSRRVFSRRALLTGRVGGGR